MANMPARVQERIVAGLKKYLTVLAAAKARDAGEADTSTIVKDILADLFGYDKYTEITSEYAIKATYCDLAIKLDAKLHLLVEVKAIGLELKDSHVKQAVDYAANQGVDWVILTNAMTWRIYRVLFEKPIGQDLVFECDLTTISPRDKHKVEDLFLFAKEGQHKSVLQHFDAERLAKSRHNLAAVILSEPVLDVIRRELRRLTPDVKIDRDELSQRLIEDVLKREVVEGDKAEDARKKVRRSQGSALKARSTEKPVESAEAAAEA